MDCAILTAGYGTRLYPVTKGQPKGLIDVAGKVLLERILNKVKELGEIDKVFIVTNNKFYEKFASWLEDYAGDFKEKIEIINDQTDSDGDRLGTIGDLDFLIKEKAISDDLFVILGDNLFEFDLNLFMKFFEVKKNTCVILKYLENKEDVKNFGVVDLDDDNKVIDFQEKPEQPNSNLISTGLYLLAKKDIDDVSKYKAEGNDMDKMGFLFEWLSRKGEVYGFVSEDEWWDIGSVEALDEVKRRYSGK
ncbi:MAG: nucleotidyltransferase family protein [archaeon]